MNLELKNLNFLERGQILALLMKQTQLIHRLIVQAIQEIEKSNKNKTMWTNKKISIAEIIRGSICLRFIVSRDIKVLNK